LTQVASDHVVAVPKAVAPLPEMVRKATEEGRRWVWWGVAGVAVVSSVLAVWVATSSSSTRTLTDPPKTTTARATTVPVPVPVPVPARAPVAEAVAQEVAKAADPETSVRPQKKAQDRAARVEKAPKKAVIADKEETTGDGALENLLNDLPTEPAGEKPAAKAKASAEPKEPEEKAVARKELGREDLSRVMNRLAPRISACAKQHQQSGTLMVHFTVEPSGEVTLPSLKNPAGNPALAECVTGVLRKGRFPAFAGRPTSFSYPFIAQ
jgi:outer membrane biosynthesis protein TonB